jgi:hypothetical protein
MVKKEKQRGALLTTWLILMIIANSFSAIFYFFLKGFVSFLLPNIPSGIWYVYGLVSLANIIFAIFLFMWKKWAFFAFCGSAVLAFIMNLSMGVGILNALFGTLGVIILYLIMRPKWNLFE